MINAWNMFELFRTGMPRHFSFKSLLVLNAALSLFHMKIMLFTPVRRGHNLYRVRQRIFFRKIFLYYWLVIVAIAAPCSGCRDAAAPVGIIASVNGEPIYLHTLQAYIDCRHREFIIRGEESLEDAKDVYADALLSLVANTLVRQELGRRGIAVSEKDVEHLLTKVGDDYGSEKFSDFFADGLISENDWKLLMIDHLSTRVFDEKVLEQGPAIGLPEITDFYNSHKTDFTLPELFSICLASSDSQKKLDQWRREFMAENFNPLDEVYSRIVDVPREELPDKWSKEILSLKSRQCAVPRQENEIWQTICLLDRKKPRVLGKAEAYPIIEGILQSDRRKRAFDEWLHMAVEKAQIWMTPALNKIISGRKISAETPAGN